MGGPRSVRAAHRPDRTAPSARPYLRAARDRRLLRRREGVVAATAIVSACTSSPTYRVAFFMTGSFRMWLCATCWRNARSCDRGPVRLAYSAPPSCAPASLPRKSHRRAGPGAEIRRGVREDAQRGASQVAQVEVHGAGRQVRESHLARVRWRYPLYGDLHTRPAIKSNRVLLDRSLLL